MSSFTDFLLFVILPLSIPGLLLILVSIALKRKDIFFVWLIAMLFMVFMSLQYRYTVEKKYDCVEAYNKNVKIEDISKTNSECNDMYKYLDTNEKDLVK